ncbi:MAG: AAA family ATPase, partial [Verrucomicrobiota bacterium]
GVPWLGFDSQPGKVLFVNFEIQPYAWQRRIAAVTRAKDIELKPGAIQLWNLRGHAADFRQLIPRILERAKSEGFALIILDPIYKVYGGTDENSAGDVAALLNAIERLAVETGAAVAYAAHFAKGNASQKETLDRISGSGVFARDPDALAIFTKHETEGAFTVEMVCRNFPPVAPFVVQWDFPLMRRDEALDPAKLKQVAGRKPENSPDDLLKVLPADGLTNADFLAAGDTEGISKRTFYRLRKLLETDGKIILSKVTGKWTPISPKQTP